MVNCLHNKSTQAHVEVAYLEDTERYSIELRVSCIDCGVRLQFVGLPMGLDLTGGATTDPDGLVARLLAVPEGTVPAPLEGVAAGFTVRRVR